MIKSIEELNSRYHSLSNIRQRYMTKEEYYREKDRLEALGKIRKQEVIWQEKLE